MQKGLNVVGTAVLKNNVNIGGNIKTKGSITALGGIVETSNAQDVTDTPEVETPESAGPS